MENLTMTTTPPNLRDLFGDKYQISHDPAALTRREKSDPWMMTIPGKFGIIYPWGTSKLAVEVNGHRYISTHLRRLPGVKVHQDGAAERTIIFPVDLFPQVAALVKSNKIPRRTPSQLANLLRGPKPSEKQGVMAP
jgi:hypothetical protein